MIYHAYQALSDAMTPIRAFAQSAMPLLDAPLMTLADPGLRRRMRASCLLLELAEITHRRPAWGIDEVRIKGETVPVTEEEIPISPFLTMRRFRKPGAESQPRVLIASPMSGHFATLLRDTVRTVLQDHDVYVTDWHNVRDVPLDEGEFGLADYTAQLIRCLRVLGPHSHLIAVCQPCVSALAAVAIMSEDDDPATPASLTLMAGPIDTRVSPTQVNRLASEKPIDWFERNLISTVPAPHPGAGRRVYPGIVQLGAFMSMNRERHTNAFNTYFDDVLNENFLKAEATRTFYGEYLAVSDLSARFYIETVSQVFQQHLLPRGEFRVGERQVDPAAIRRTALVTIEGERDDICAIGQTLAAQDLARSLRAYMRTHHLQPNVGHYGVFSGRRWQNHIYPVVRNTIHVSH